MIKSLQKESQAGRNSSSADANPNAADRGSIDSDIRNIQRLSRRLQGYFFIMSICTEVPLIERIYSTFNEEQNIALSGTMQFIYHLSGFLYSILYLMNEGVKQNMRRTFGRYCSCCFCCNWISRSQSQVSDASLNDSLYCDEISIELPEDQQELSVDYSNYSAETDSQEGSSFQANDSLYSI